ncbi:MAG: Gfo/Idh/MocA family oxidoreductase [Spirochaetes bacterium]|nr:Gfo/Idh/MocA family oxidoreductase [Spirochaetota bacterium]
MSTANIAILSTGHVHAKMFIENTMKSADGRKVTHIWDDVAERGKKYAALCGAAFEPDIDKVIADPSIHGFIICKENTQHLPLLEKAIRTGKPVMLEKPLVTTTADLAAVKKLHAHYPAPLFCGYVLPFSGSMKAVAALVNAGAFGDILRVKFRNSQAAAYNRMFDEPERAWLHDPKLAGGGALQDGGQQAVHLLLSLFGPVKEVWACIRNESGVYPRVEDFGIAHLKFASGVMGTIEVGWTQTGGIGGIEISGSKSTLWNDGRRYVMGTTGGEAKAVTDLDEDPVRVDRLAAAIRGELTEEVLAKDFEAICGTVAVLEAMYTSAAQGTWVKVR